MKRIAKGILTAIVFAGAFTPALAETVSKKQTEQVARMFFNEAHHRVMGEPKLVYTGKKLTTDRLFHPFHVYNFPSGGFVIVSVENKAFPILGYSLKTNFDPERLTKGEKSLLREYAADIERIRYDSDIPYGAIEAWGNLPEYISGILGARRQDFDMRYSSQDASEIVSNIFTTDRADELSSDIFSPDQWQTLIDEELSKRGEVVIGIADGGDVRPAIVSARKGDYYNIRFESPNDWLMRLHATEILSAGQVAELDEAPVVEQLVAEDDPFEFYDSFIEETDRERAQRERMFETRLHPEQPVLSALGGGHFQIWFPQRIRLLRLYNLNGSMVTRQTYGETDTASLDMSALPRGFYFATVEGDNGESYGFKLWR